MKVPSSAELPLTLESFIWSGQPLSERPPPVQVAAGTARTRRREASSHSQSIQQHVQPETVLLSTTQPVADTTVQSRETQAMAPPCAENPHAANMSKGSKKEFGEDHSCLIHGASEQRRGRLSGPHCVAHKARAGQSGRSLVQHERSAAELSAVLCTIKEWSPRGQFP